MDLLLQDMLRYLRAVSVAGLGVVAVLGGAATYWLAGRVLQPVRDISQAARRVSAQTLDTRLALDGPHDELKELADTFDTMLERLQRAFKQQRRFVADAAHELRTPLATLRTNLEVVRADPTASPAAYRQMAVTLERSLGRLERLVEDLLVLAREEHITARQEIALGPLLEEVLLDLRPMADERLVVVEYSGALDLSVRGDEALLSRVFHNVVENGIRYNRPGGTVAIAIRRQDTWAVVTVADSGIGIPPEDQPQIFERFYRVDRSRARHTGGLGLGLAIAADVVRRHGGTICVESTLGVGSTFTIRLPL
jgi:signal transduction histidine kinase